MLKGLLERLAPERRLAWSLALGLVVSSCVEPVRLGNWPDPGEVASGGSSEGSGGAAVTGTGGQLAAGGADAVPECLLTPLEVGFNQQAQDCGDASAVFCTDYDDGPRAEWTAIGASESWYDACETRTGMGRAFRAVQTAGAPAGHTRHFIDLPEPIISGTLYGRIYAYIPSEVVLPSFMTIMAFWTEERFHTAESSLAILPSETLGVSSNLEAPLHAAAGLLSRDTWHCFEIEIELDDLNGTLTGYLDGQVVAFDSGFDSLPDAGINTIVSGVAFPSSESRAEILLDDFLVATERLGCDTTF